MRGETAAAGRSDLRRYRRGTGAGSVRYRPARRSAGPAAPGVADSGKRCVIELSEDPARTGPALPGPAQTRSAQTRSALTWSLLDRRPADIPVVADEARAGGGPATGRGVRVCVVDSGIERDHPMVGPVEGSWAVVPDDGGGLDVRPTDVGDVCGHGTACAGIIRRVAPDCELFSVQVLGDRFSGTGDMLVAGLRWAIGQGFDVINLSLSTTRARFAEQLRALADEAYFRGTAIVASSHNNPVESYPWRFASVISVGGHQEDDPDLYLYNPDPPVEFFAPGRNVQVAWPGGGSVRTTGNSFATPHITGLCARILSRHPRATPFQLKTALYLSAANVRIR